MKGRAWPALAAAGLLVALAQPIVAQEIALVGPEPGAPAFGEVELRVEIYPADTQVERVEIYVDGFRTAQAAAPPYVFQVDVGQANVEHRFEAVAYPADGRPLSASLRTAPVRSDLEVDVELQQLYVTVSRGAKRLQDLEREDFIVFDDARRQKLVTFERGSATDVVPFTAVLLLDASASMGGGQLPVALAGLRRFSSAMRTLDEAKLVLFSDRVLLETPFTNLPALLTLGLDAVEPDGGTAINDVLYLALKRLDRRQGRKVIVLLSDGVDVDSVLAIDQVRWLARRHQAAFYWLQLPAHDGAPAAGLVSAWRDAEGHRRELDGLAAAAVESGGRVEPIASVGEIEGALRRLLAELREQYVLGYYPPAGDRAGRWHDIEVRVRRRGADVRHRSGYVVD